MNFKGKGWPYVIFGLVGVLLIFEGCAGKKRERPLVSLTVKSLPQVCSMAVLPFQNQTKYPAAGLMLYRIFLSEMARSKEFHVVEEGMIRRILLRGKVFPGKPLTPELQSMIYKATHVDALLSGEVVVAEEEKDRIYLAFELKVRETETGRLLWTTYYAREGEDYRKVMHFGEIGTLTGLARQMIIDILKSWHEKRLGGCQ